MYDRTPYRKNSINQRYEIQYLDKYVVVVGRRRRRRRCRHHRHRRRFTAINFISQPKLDDNFTMRRDVTQLISIRPGYLGFAVPCHAPYHVPCHVMSCHLVECHVTPRRVTPEIAERKFGPARRQNQTSFRVRNSKKYRVFYRNKSSCEGPSVTRAKISPQKGV